MERLTDRTMKSYFVAAFALSLTLAFGSFVHPANASGCVDPAEYRYDGYKPPPIYYRAYYGDNRVCGVHVHRHAHAVPSRGQVGFGAKLLTRDEARRIAAEIASFSERRLRAIARREIPGLLAVWVSCHYRD